MYHRGFSFKLLKTKGWHNLIHAFPSTPLNKKILEIITVYHKSNIKSAAKEI